MPNETAPLPDFGSLQRGRFTYLPVVPGRLEFAVEVRRRILKDRPEVVAVELPATLEDLYLKAVARLPQISVIFYNDTAYKRDPEAQPAVYVPVEPADPFVEAIRTAQEIGAQVVFADPDSTERPHLPDTYPDTFALTSIALEDYAEAYRVYPQPRTDETARFAEAMAWKLQGADPFARVMVIVSLNLLDPVLDAMEQPQSEPKRRRREELQLVNPQYQCARGGKPGRSPPHPDGALQGIRKVLRSEHRREDALVAAPSARALQPQPRHHPSGPHRLALRPHHLRALHCR
jgi:hypothetical protein